MDQALIDLPKFGGGAPQLLRSLGSYGPAVIVEETMPWQMKTDCDGEKTAQIPGESTLKTFNLPNYADNFGLCRLPAAAAAAPAARTGGRLLADRAGRSVLVAPVATRLEIVKGQLISE